MQHTSTPSPTLRSPAAEVSALLMRLALERLMPHFVSVVTELGLSPPQAHLLLQLGEGRTISQRELAKELACDPSNLTGISDRLEARGLVARRTDPIDRRIKAIVATPEGEALRHQLMEHLARAPDFVGHLSAVDQSTLQKLLIRLMKD